MLRHLPLSLSTLILLLLSSTAWALGVAFTNAAFEGITTGTPFDIEWVGDGTVSGPSDTFPRVGFLLICSP